MFYVIGSGAASISAAMALAREGREVTILDAGKTLEPERQEVLNRLSRQEPPEWAPEDLDFLRGGDQKTRHGKIHSKQTYGSEYVYEHGQDALRDDPGNAGFHYSMARGGLTNVWGASLAPYRAADIADWPVKLSDLEPHYRAVLDFMPSTAVEDELADLLPTFSPGGAPLNPSRQIQSFLGALRARREGLTRSGIFYGRSRIALKAAGDDRRKGCVYCGRCLLGCPYSLIYSAAQTLDELIARGSVRYIKDHVVERLEPVSGGVKIHARDVTRGESAVFQAERVYAGCGLLPTAHLALSSLEAFDIPLRILDSQYFIYPFLQFSQTPDAQKEALHTLTQAFLEIDDPRVSQHLVHLQVFSYSDFLERALRQTPLGFFLRNDWIAQQLFGRLLVLQGFLHSDDSARMSVELRRATGGGGQNKLHIRDQPRADSFWTSIRAGLKLAFHAAKLRGVPVIPAIQFAAPGRSYHSGGTFPMRHNPGRFETDTLGQLPGLERVHLIDASVFPSIPATTITLSIMANAHRIAQQSL